MKAPKFNENCILNAQDLYNLARACPYLWQVQYFDEEHKRWLPVKAKNLRIVDPKVFKEKGGKPT